MSRKEVQILGTLAKNLPEKKQNIFLNKESAVQYIVEPIVSNIDTTEYYTGYKSSLLGTYADDKFLDDEERFADYIGDQLFLFFCREAYEGEYPQLIKANLIPKPKSFYIDVKYCVIPVFAAAKDRLVNAWEQSFNWTLFRDYNSLGEFKNCIKTKQPLGSLYGYNTDYYEPDFVIWKEADGELYAIGQITDGYFNNLGGITLEGSNLVKCNISEYMQSIIYHVDINPTILFLPETVADAIRRKLTEKTENYKLAAATREKDYIYIEEDEWSHIQFEDLVEEDEIAAEDLIEIKTSVKNDELIISAMDYYSQERNLYYSMHDFVNVHTAIKCSNLVILSGLSGTGKSALVDVYAKALGIDSEREPERMLFIPVRPSWNDDSDLLGYVDLVHMMYHASDTGFLDLLVEAQKEENQNKLYMVCFDEMNLARVEHYFSRFLSLLERPAGQRELQLYDEQYAEQLRNANRYPSKIKIGDNIRFIGTVNIDESTYHFSDKVLDRANVIQLEVLNYATEWKKKHYIAMPAIEWTYEEYKNLQSDNVLHVNANRFYELLWELHEMLQQASSKYGIGPRIVKAIEEYICNLPQTEIAGFDAKIGLDYQILQRVLTKVRGPENQFGDILREDSEQNFYRIFDKYKDLSKFEKCRKVIAQKQKELQDYGYCI